MILCIYIYNYILCFDFSKTNKKISTSRREIIFTKFFEDFSKQTQVWSKTFSVLKKSRKICDNHKKQKLSK